MAVQRHDTSATAEPPVFDFDTLAKPLPYVVDNDSSSEERSDSLDDVFNNEGTVDDDEFHINAQLDDDHADFDDEQLLDDWLDGVDFDEELLEDEEYLDAIGLALNEEEHGSNGAYDEPMNVDRQLSPESDAPAVNVASAPVSVVAQDRFDDYVYDEEEDDDADVQDDTPATTTLLQRSSATSEAMPVQDQERHDFGTEDEYEEDEEDEQWNVATDLMLEANDPMPSLGKARASATTTTTTTSVTVEHHRSQLTSMEAGGAPLEDPVQHAQRRALIWTGAAMVLIMAGVILAASEYRRYRVERVRYYYSPL